MDRSLLQDGWYKSNWICLIPEESWHDISTINYLTTSIAYLAFQCGSDIEQTGWNCFCAKGETLYYYIIPSFWFSSIGWICFDPCTSLHANWLMWFIALYVIVFERKQWNWLESITPTAMHLCIFINQWNIWTPQFQWNQVISKSCTKFDQLTRPQCKWLLL